MGVKAGGGVWLGTGVFIGTWGVRVAVGSGVYTRMKVGEGEADGSRVSVRVSVGDAVGRLVAVALGEEIVVLFTSVEVAGSAVFVLPTGVAV